MKKNNYIQVTCNGNKITITKIENIINSKKSEFISKGDYDNIKALMLSNKADILNLEPENMPEDIRELVENSELYYGFNEEEIKKFLAKVEKLGYTFNYVDLATRDNGGLDHTVKPYALREIEK